MKASITTRLLLGTLFLLLLASSALAAEATPAETIKPADATAPAAPPTPVMEAKLEAVSCEAGWPFTLTADQTKRLHDIGFAFDADELLIARTIAARGFSAKQYVDAVLTWKAEGFTTKDDVELIVVMEYMGIPASNMKKDMDDVRKNPTLYYNDRVYGGNTEWMVGWPLFALGMQFGLTGTILALSASENFDKFPPMWTTALVGFGVTLASIPVVAVGGVKRQSWVPDGLLEKGTLSELAKHRRESSGAMPKSSENEKVAVAPSAPAWQFAPVFLKDGGGAAVLMQW